MTRRPYPASGVCRLQGWRDHGVRTQRVDAVEHYGPLGPAPAPKKRFDLA